MDLKAWLQRSPIIAILRGVTPAEVEAIASTLEDCGVFIVEVPLNSPDALKSISTLARVFGDRLLIGAGTLTDAGQVAQVAAAGGRLIVTPHAETTVVVAAKSAGLLAVPGFFNPTEAFALLRAGADALKLFPAEVLGPPMVKALQAVLPRDTLILPVGGIDATTVQPWIAAGVRGVGAASSIYKPGDGPGTVRSKANALLNAIRHHQVAPPTKDASE